HEALEKAGISELAKRPFGQLSGGQKQLVLLARALAQEVNLFFMDEPVNGLDYGNQIRLLELIDSLAKEGYTFLKTTHYPDHALLVSSRVAVMNGGTIIADGAPDEVIRSSMIEKVYGIKADIITHGAHARCVPVFHNKH
ncbi:MAG: ABC transporter ATP-binding protein, partial [Thiovulaceae bacterium]|nr:ABC transporter ATP-binding protein [Sulfurimonadaceae bacterium]